MGVCLPTSSSIGFALGTQTSVDLGADLKTAFQSGNTITATIDATANGTVAATGAVVTLSAATIANLNVGDGGSTSVAIFEVSSATTVTTWSNSAATAKVDNSASVTVGSLVTGNSIFSVWNNVSAAAVTFNNIDFTARASMGTKTGTVHVSGGSVIVNASGVTGVTASATASAILKVTGGASVSTSANSGSLPQGVTIDVSAQGTSGPVAVVDAGTVLNTTGQITGDNGVLSINGQLILGATSANVKPKVIVNSGATVAINAAAAFHATAVSIASGATLQLGASTQAAAQQGNVVIDQMAQCLGTININLASSASVFASGSMAGAAIAFNYSSTNNVAELVKCKVQVTDSTGATVLLQSTTSASAAAGRRLLATSNTATWGSNGMSYQMTGQSNSALPSCIVLPAVVVSFLGLLL